MAPTNFGFYRARDGMMLGVCKGLARYRGLPVAGVRIVVIFLTILTGFWPGVLLYALAGLLMEPEPLVKPESPQESDFYSRFHGSRVEALQELHRKMTSLDSRIQRMETHVTQPDFDWENRLRSRKS